MSLGLAIMLSDGIVLMADGRQTYPQAKESHTCDCIDKLEPIDVNSFAIPFGVTQATECALKFLKKSWSPSLGRNHIKQLVDICVSDSWKYFLSKLAPDVDKDHETMRAALIVAGLSEMGPYIVASLHGTNVRQPPLLIIDSPLKFILLGGEKHNAEEYFIQQMENGLRGVKNESMDGPVNDVVNAVLFAGKSTIRHIEGLDSSIGGRIKFAVFREGYAPLKGNI